MDFNYIIVIVCLHPEGIKPTCKCGASAARPICGYGYGASPCVCMPQKSHKEMVKNATEKYKNIFSEAWIELAK